MEVDTTEQVHQPARPHIAEPLYVRYYAGHQGRFGHEFLGTYGFDKVE